MEIFSNRIGIFPKRIEICPNIPICTKKFICPKRIKICPKRIGICPKNKYYEGLAPLGEPRAPSELSILCLTKLTILLLWVLHFRVIEMLTNIPL